MHGAQRARAARQNNHAGQHTSGQADHCDAFPLRCYGRLFLVQSRALLLIHPAESSSDLLHQLIPLVCQTPLAVPTKQVLITQLHHVLHGLEVLRNHGFNLDNGTKPAWVVSEEKFEFIHLRRHGFGCGVKWTQMRLFAGNGEAACRAFHLA